jgi:hypothetical protein
VVKVAGRDCTKIAHAWATIRAEDEEVRAAFQMAMQGNPKGLQEQLCHMIKTAREKLLE